MAVSIEIYRQRIGTFVPSSKQKILKYSASKTSFNKFNRSKPRKPIIADLIISIIIWTILTLAASSILQRNNYQDSFQLEDKSIPTLPTNDVHFFSSSSWDIATLYSWIVGMGLNWPYNSTSNLAHYIYGNRRNVGYKYFSWNCDRGLISKHKIEDIKTFATRHRPHFMGISEVDLRRNESNCNLDSTNEFSTSQVHESLKIDGYRLILPSSWEIHD